jgi:hypothetical protein
VKLELTGGKKSVESLTLDWIVVVPTALAVTTYESEDPEIDATDVLVDVKVTVRDDAKPIPLVEILEVNPLSIEADEKLLLIKLSVV